MFVLCAPLFLYCFDQRVYVSAGCICQSMYACIVYVCQFVNMFVSLCPRQCVFVCVSAMSIERCICVALSVFV